MEPIRIFISYAHANAVWLRNTVRDRAGAMEPKPRDLLTYRRGGPEGQQVPDHAPTGGAKIRLRATGWASGTR